MQAICFETSSRIRRTPSWIDPYQYAVDRLVSGNADTPKLDAAVPANFCCQVVLEIMLYIIFLLVVVVEILTINGNK